MIACVCSPTKHDGLRNDDPPCKPLKRLEEYNVWKDPDRQIVKKRSIPNKMKRFLAELRGDPRLFIDEGKGRRDSSWTQKSYNVSMPTTTGSSVTGNWKPSGRSVIKIDDGPYPDRFFSLVRKAKCHKLKNARPCEVQVDRTQIRCETCDYQHDPWKRRHPPHTYRPILVPMPDSSHRKMMLSNDSKPSTTYLSLPGIRDNPVQRLKRRRSSTELYKNMVSVT